MDGISDLSAGIEILFRNFKLFFKEELTNMLAWRLAKSVEETLNTLLLSHGEIIDLNSKDNQANYINATLIVNPIFNDGFISFPLDGNVLSTYTPTRGKKNQTEQVEAPPTNFPLMPVFVGDSDDVQVQLFISQRTLNSAMYTLHENEMLEMTHKVTSTYLKTFFTNFEEVFGYNPGVRIVMKSLTVPQIDISEDATTIKA